MNRSHWILVAIVAIAGCGGSTGADNRPETATGEGVLSFKGDPVEGATVVLAPEFPGATAYTASAITESDGSFTLSSFPPDEGVVPGTYLVGVSKVEASTAAAAEPAGGHEEYVPVETKNLLPAKYSDPNSSGLKIEIPAGGASDLKLDLQ